MAIIHTRVLIIGAGISGIKAAQDLNDYGVDFLICEARDRVGGRLHSVPMKNGTGKVDLGASWFHDTLANELFDEVVEKGSYGLYYDDSDPLYITKDGVLDEKAMRLPQVTNEMNKFIELDAFENLDQKDVSLKAKVNEYLFKQRQLLTDDQIKYSPQMLRLLELWHGIGWESMSSKYAMVDNVGRNCMITDGYGALVDDMLQSISHDKVKLRCVIKKIERKGNAAIVKTSAGDEIHCEYCIITVPQSILQLSCLEDEGAIEWVPELPKRITSALSNMHYGSLGKFVFEFEEIFWDGESTDRFVALGSSGDDALASARANKKLNVENLIPESDALPSTWEFPVLILNLYKSYKVPALLVFTQGSLTRALEKEPNKAWDHVKPILQKLATTSEPIPIPSNVIPSSWSQDPYSRGSYAACYPGDDPSELIIQLGRGLGNIRFAGEHTISDGAGAVHGAWMSGKREADYVLKKIGLKGGDIDEI